ncbi:MAG: phosphate signaling complex protein PhoU [Candidatus Kapabacteria bacterium]|nr:phosphate signaling complex protein PhoU [Ignavibacteriota bacterium]MCW5884711.1 phosphate signaling complex protein PhoU [Candidatus Kapabacteria bacterium]
MINLETAFEMELNILKGDISSYVSLIETMLDKAVNGLFSKNTDLLNEVIFSHEPRANRLEIIIDEKCISLIAKYSPKASSLRNIQSLMKINLDLERMADHTVNISRDAIDLLNISPILSHFEIAQMAEGTRQMILSGFKSFIVQDIDLARHVCNSDNEIDSYRQNIMAEIIATMKSDPKTIEKSLHYISIIRNIERIADLATNIAENSIFAINGNTIKHSYK